jgi:hypothetical protein
VLVWSARLGEASVDGERRGLVVIGEVLMLQFDGLEAPRQACVDEEVAGDEAELQSFTVVLGVTPNGGDEDGWCGQGFGVGKMEQRGRKRARVRRGVFILRWNTILVTNWSKEKLPARGGRS